MKKIDFNAAWYCCHVGGEKNAKLVNLPHDAMLGEPRSLEVAGGRNTGWFHGYDYQYSKKFSMAAEDRAKTVFFEFEGVYHNVEVYLNGEKVTFRPYGYTNFYVNATKYLYFDRENEIVVIARNSDQPNSRWYSGAGIYRPVHMYVLEPNHILLNGIKVKTLSIHPAIIEVSIAANGKGKAGIEILDGEQIVARTFCECKKTVKVKLEIPNAKLWNVDEPNLYTCRVSYEQEVRTVSFGIRTLTWDAQNGIAINGNHIIIKGACIHHDNGLLGACAYPEAEERKICILQENGYNAVRSAHNPCSKALLDACDRLGMLVMDEYVDVWYIHKTQNDYANYFMDWWKHDLYDMVEKDYNHPSVILYSTGNEVSETAQKKGIKLTKKLTKYLHSLDDTRPVTCGVNIFFNFLSSIGLGVYSDNKAEKESKEKKDKKLVGSEFFNVIAGIFGAHTMKLGAMLPPCDWKTKGAYANMDIAGYNYGILRYPHDLKKYPKRLILGSETFCSDAYQFIELAKKNPRLVGDFVWAGMDYIGEVGIGAWEYGDYAIGEANENAGWLTAGSGRIDITGKPNAEALYTRVALEKENQIYLAVKPVYQTGKHSPSAWKMTEAIASWDWTGCDGKKAVVEIYARAASVELFLNGKSVGKKAMGNKCNTSIETKYEAGELTAVGYDETGKEILRNSLYTAKEKTYLRAVPEKESIQKNGLGYIRLQYTDVDGIVKPMEKHRVKVSVTGGTLLGLGNACPYNTDGYLKDETNSYYGELLAIVQATEGEEVTLTATDGERETCVTIPCKA